MTLGRRLCLPDNSSKVLHEKLRGGEYDDISDITAI